MPLKQEAHMSLTQMPTSPLSMLYQWEKERPDANYLSQPVDGKVTEYNWAEFATLVRKVAAGIQRENLAPGSRICILSKNCVEWFVTDLAIMMAGHISVPIFATAGQNTIEYVLQHSDTQLIFVGKLDDTENQVKAIPDNIKSVAFPYPNINVQQQWCDFIDGEPLRGEPNVDMESTATIIYTSGSTGQPKGVVHTFNTICWAAQNSLQALSVNDKDRVLSYLPLAHITERVLVEYASLYSAMQVSFVESLDTFQRDVVACQPTLFISVPRLWTKFQMGVLAKIPQKKLNIMLKIPILKGIVAKKIREGLGINQARLWASGSAPLAPATIHWFERLGINISEGWGMTENCAYGTSSVPFRSDKVGCIGHAYEGVDIRISDEGEIQVNSPCNMKEYYLEPEKTKEAFTDDGWLRTGDKGTIDADGYVRITGRLKDIFKTAKGKYVTPAPIEAKIMQNEVVEQVCVTGNNLSQPIALLVLSEDARKQPRTDVEPSLLTTLEKVNAGLESHQRLDRIVVMNGEWTIENELLTPTLKVKRHIIEERFEDVIQKKYSGKVVWSD
ncbi:AMP-binding protein [Alteromonas oceanisediminis]|uniref:AMP-binding protein n=1 Tax=Alteromonas oceanisediminis TaxID=2836180 RepID=UPI001BD927CC|nr:AMP-binding protein [Alteromonas oceanisediminis]MBT0587354.1 AMP-binding protein [Alteromonas oceanisediminis]